MCRQGAERRDEATDVGALYLALVIWILQLLLLVIDSLLCVDVTTLYRARRYTPQREKSTLVVHALVRAQPRLGGGRTIPLQGCGAAQAITRLPGAVKRHRDRQDIALTALRLDPPSSSSAAAEPVASRLKG